MLTVSRYIDSLISDAICLGASDLHFEPSKDSFRIRRRIDGVLHELCSPPPELIQSMASRLKIMANLDIAERRLPQDGHFNFSQATSLIDCRVSTCPTVYGEKVVLRILNAAQMQRDITNLGFDKVQFKIVDQILRQSQGMIIVTGPTGSGKTVSLYALLEALNSPDINICTVEDPVEIQLFGLNQVTINLKAELDFATILRAFLRQDPDVIMVGEMRDLETAEIAMKASQTGHLVLTTLHTNSAAQSIIRLKQMGLASYTLAHSISLIIAQRLLRRLCPYCKKAIQVPNEIMLEQHCPQTVYIAQGCERCHLGYKGRLAIFEILPIFEDVQEVILHNADIKSLQSLQLSHGFESLRAMGLTKIIAGETSLDELNRVTTGRYVQ